MKELRVAATVCDTDGKILWMNEKAVQTFTSSGGEALIGTSLLDCHPGESRSKLERQLQNGLDNTYTIEKNGIRKMIVQRPWFKAGVYSGLIEFSIELPAEIPHFVRG